MKRTFSIILILYFQLWMVFSKTPNTKYWRSFQSEDGPSFESNCYGSRQQSPIDLPKNGIKTQYEDFEYHNYSETPSKYSIINNGHTVKLFQMKDSSFPPFIIGGGLHSIYKFAQLHFHWGNSSTFGSEHTIDEEAFPLELHMVHFNSKYGTNLEEAVQKGNGSFDTLAVLGILFEVQEEDNLAFDEIKFVTPQDKQSFYRYMGSLTTPLCDQIVVWTVYKETVGISERQLEQFRELRARQTKYPLVNTFRSVQSVNGRLVFEVSSSQKGSLLTIYKGGQKSFRLQCENANTRKYK
ncbi:CA [Lepeophtheirus salmonis]|uniref:Carbonic anhydrase n=1 Tax=Lepeophtheirus salmonis TaxID=72036 RepID=A0A7R8D3K5_LEPSM|nr:CA [Lepeophtheirus salmonis]CAF3017916.1 CA [Lepeophtheirus salmonis]